MVKKYSVILLSAEGTLTDRRGTIPENTLRLLRRLEQKGIPVVLVSGQMPCQVEAAAEAAGLRTPIVCYDGSLILDEKRSILADSGIDRQTAEHFKDMAEELSPGCAAAAFLYDICVAADAANPRLAALDNISPAHLMEGPMLSAADIPGHAHKLFFAGDPVGIRRLRQEAGREFPWLALSVRNAPVQGVSILEAVSASADRAAALEAVGRYYGAGREQIVVLGSGMADLPSLGRAGLGIAMGNAPEAVRQAAARVTASNDEEGVYIALKNLRFAPPPFLHTEETAEQTKQ